LRDSRVPEDRRARRGQAVLWETGNVRPVVRARSNSTSPNKARLRADTYTRQYDIHCEDDASNADGGYVSFKRAVRRSRLKNVGSIQVCRGYHDCSTSSPFADAIVKHRRQQSHVQPAQLASYTAVTGVRSAQGGDCFSLNGASNKQVTRSIPRVATLL
jgi:hypothetical protein